MLFGAISRVAFFVGLFPFPCTIASFASVRFNGIIGLIFFASLSFVFYSRARGALNHRDYWFNNGANGALSMDVRIGKVTHSAFNEINRNILVKC
jgi:hypothetical protein